MSFGYIVHYCIISTNGKHRVVILLSSLLKGCSKLTSSSKPKICPISVKRELIFIDQGYISSKGQAEYQGQVKAKVGEQGIHNGYTVPE